MKKALPIPPTLFAEFTFLFDHDFPIELVDEQLGLNPTESKRQSQTRINPITQKHNPGFWVLKTKAMSSFDIKPLLLEVKSFLSAHSSGLHQVIQQYCPSCFMLRIRVLVRQDDEYPAIRFNPAIIKLLSAFNATIDIDIENNPHSCCDAFSE